MKTVASGAEAKLLEVTSGLKASPDGYYALHYHFSKLQEEFRSDYQIKIAVNVLGDLFKGLDAILFILKDCDIVVLYNGSNRGLLEKSIFQLRYLFMDDYLAYTQEGFENEDFCSVYDLEFQWRDFFVACKQKLGKNIEEMERPRIKETKDIIASPKGNRSKLQIFSHSNLDNIASEIENIDIGTCLRSQAVCAVLKTDEPKILFKEIYTNISELQHLLSSNIDLMSNKTLFKYLTKTLDKKVLNSLKERQNSNKSSISINLNIKTLFTEEFADFDAKIPIAQKSSIIIEISVADIFEDIQQFMIAQREIQNLGYRICLDGLDDLSFMHINRQNMGFDLAKLRWNPKMGTTSTKDKSLIEAIKICGKNRIILCHCGSKEAIEYGKKVGISLFQGRYIDAIISPNAILVN
jgi:EAL domain-containing protein (putative c-di-GMP-specific phosphodiesterase class I)